MTEAECIFCKIVAGTAPGVRIYEDDSVIAILDIFPWARGHSLVIPRNHAATIWDVSSEDAEAVMRAAHRLAPALRDTVGAEGMNLLQSNGRAAWQTVDHLHLHLIPRWADDALVPPGTSSKADPDELRKTADRIADLLGTPGD
ncbi:MAG TPA: HIT family protein [Actinomycetota bacterium]|nr:HIT family protein [Actinomycetota bacterium]